MLMMVVMMTILSSEPLLSMVIRECGGCCQHSSLTPWVSLLLCTLSPQPAPEPSLTHSWAVLRLLEPLLVCANVALEVPGNLWLAWQSWFWGQPWGLTHTVSIPFFRMEPLCPSPPLPKSLSLYFQGISAHRLDLTSREAGSQEDLPEGKEPAWGLAWGQSLAGHLAHKSAPKCLWNKWMKEWLARTATLPRRQQVQMQLQRTFWAEAFTCQVPLGLCSWGPLVLGSTSQPRVQHGHIHIPLSSAQTCRGVVSLLLSLPQGHFTKVRDICPEPLKLWSALKSPGCSNADSDLVRQGGPKSLLFWTSFPAHLWAILGLARS